MLRLLRVSLLSDIHGAFPRQVSPGLSSLKFPHEPHRLIAVIPIATLISVPFEPKFDYRMDPNNDGFRLTVVPLFPKKR